MRGLVSVPVQGRLAPCRHSSQAKAKVLVAPVRPAGPRRALYAGQRALRLAAAASPAAPAPAAPAPAARDAPHWQQALAELDKKEGRKLCVVQTAPAVRVAIAETLGLPPGSVTPGQMVTGLKRLGFDYVFDTLFGADLTIMEEGSELIGRLEAAAAARRGEAPPASAGHEASAALPMWTSCCPGWVSMVEQSNPELIPYLSTCKSPQMMLGSVIKNYFAKKLAGLNPADVVSCSVMPCVRKQGEADREWFATESGARGDHGRGGGADDCACGLARDVDHVMTTVELGKELPETEYDNPLGTGSGGGLLFGTTGGVMEAALRTVYELISGQPMGRVVFEEVRGMDGIKQAAITIPVGPDSRYKHLETAPGQGVTLRIAVANGLGNAKKLVKEAAGGAAPYDFIEVMACPGGCIGGGGQPRSTDKGILAKRQAAMYTLDERNTVRRSHENPNIQKLYAEWPGLEQPLSHLAHEKLHTHYVPRGAEEAAGGGDKK
ncbi:iron hydrogenase [Raphidocelis subcapitata]|uniref:Iron hydrogenase n=1 Tax=Raphidocelis subcapitata TaxID=307507 RepID=A0A2V0PD20_9CHLO|nr:iron hydrogenase [Raphidocelis subcapitata]|eukprot:GBF95803.1 iron hydrogenase [Raphidocelis subcapitata]